MANFEEHRLSLVCSNSESSALEAPIRLARDELRLAFALGVAKLVRN